MIEFRYFSADDLLLLYSKFANKLKIFDLGINFRFMLLTFNLILFYLFNFINFFWTRVPILSHI